MNYYQPLLIILPKILFAGRAKLDSSQHHLWKRFRRNPKSYDTWIFRETNNTELVDIHIIKTLPPLLCMIKLNLCDMKESQCAKYNLVNKVV